MAACHPNTEVNDIRSKYQQHRKLTSAVLRRKTRRLCDEDRQLSRHRLLLKRRFSENSTCSVTEGEYVQHLLLLKRRSNDLSLIPRIQDIVWASPEKIALFFKDTLCFDSLISLFSGHNSVLLHQAASLLSTLSAFSNEHSLRMTKGAGAYLVTYLDSSSLGLQDHAALTIGNLSGSGPAASRLLTCQGALPALVGLLPSRAELVVQSACWALDNLLENSPALVIEKLAELDLRPVLRRHCGRKTDALEDLLLLLLSVSRRGKCDYLVQLQPTLCTYLSAGSCEEPEVIITILGILGQSTCDEIVSSFPSFPSFIDAHLGLNTSLSHPLLWFLANLSAVSERACTALLSHRQLLAKISCCCLRSDERELVEECLRCLCHCFYHLPALSRSCLAVDEKYVLAVCQQLNKFNSLAPLIVQFLHFVYIFAQEQQLLLTQLLNSENFEELLKFVETLANVVPPIEL